MQTGIESGGLESLRVSVLHCLPFANGTNVAGDSLEILVTTSISYCFI